MPRILLVDDDIAEISAVKRVLARAGLTAVLATNASDALASIDGARPDLLLVAAACEGGEGLALARGLAGAPERREIPLLLLGAAPDPPAGAAVLPRPLDPTALADEVRRLLDRPAGEGAPARPPAAREAAPGSPAPGSPESSPGPPAGAPPGRATPAERSVPFERRVAPFSLPGPLERRQRPSDPENARRAAAAALRARAEELRRAADEPPFDAAPAPPAAAEAAAGLDALFQLSPIGGDGREEAAPIAETPFDLPPEPEAPPAAPSPAPVASPARAEAPLDLAATGPPPTSSRSLEADLPHAAEPPRPELAGGDARTDPLLSFAAEPAPAPPPALDGPPAPAATAPGSATGGVPEPAGAGPAEELEARRLLEEDVRALRAQLEAEREEHGRELRSALERAAQEELAAAARRLEDLAAARARELEEATADAARRAAAEVEERAAAALEQLRAQAEGEAARRTEAEEALARLSGEAARLAAERAAEEAARVAAAAAAEEAARVAAAAAAEEAARVAAAAAVEEAARVAAAAAAEEAARVAAAAATEEAARVAAETAAAREAARSAGRTPAAARPAPTERSRAAEPAPPATLREIPPPPPELQEGNLEDLPAPRLLALAARAGLTGRLDLAGGARRSIWFEGGRVVGARSASPGERIEELALRLGLLTREGHRQVADAAAALPTRRVALLLVERGLVRAEELTALVRRQTEEVLFGAFGEVGLRFRWAPEPVPPEERTVLDRPPLALALEGVRRRWLAPRVEAVLGGPETLLAPAPAAPPPEELRLSPDELRLLALADGLRTLDELVASSSLDPLSTRQLLAGLVLVGGLTVRVVAAGRPSAEVAAAILRARLEERLDQVRRADYFTILGVGRLATPHEVREAAARLLAEFDPDRLAAAGADAGPRAAEIRAVVADARDVLSDDRLRGEYLRALAG